MQPSCIMNLPRQLSETRHLFCSNVTQHIQPFREQFLFNRLKDLAQNVRTPFRWFPVLIILIKYCICSTTLFSICFSSYNIGHVLLTYTIGRLDNLSARRFGHLNEVELIGWLRAIPEYDKPLYIDNLDNFESPHQGKLSQKNKSQHFTEWNWCSLIQDLAYSYKILSFELQRERRKEKRYWTWFVACIFIISFPVTFL